MQGDIAGTLHPNAAGQNAIALEVLRVVQGQGRQGSAASAPLCETRYVICFSRSKSPMIAANIARGQVLGLPQVLTYLGGTDEPPGTKAQTDRDRQAACGPTRLAQVFGTGVLPGGDSCDEYPFASTVEGGETTVIAAVPLAENNSQGGMLSRFYQTAFGMVGGRTAQFLVLVTP